METNFQNKITYDRPLVLSIGGFDPSGGAGVLADVKTFEVNKVLGLAVSTAITIQNENEFNKIYWLSALEIKEQLEILFNSYEIGFVKIGLIENAERLADVISIVKQYNSTVKIIWDPILKASAGFAFHDNFNWNNVAQKVYLITPNYLEAQTIFNHTQPEDFLRNNNLGCAVFLKGGHRDGEFATDILFAANENFQFQTEKLIGYEKHGSGCVLSSVIVSNLAKGQTLENACGNAKEYVTRFLESNKNKLGYHHSSES